MLKGRLAKSKGIGLRQVSKVKHVFVTQYESNCVAPGMHLHLFWMYACMSVPFIIKL